MFFIIIMFGFFIFFIVIIICLFRVVFRIREEKKWERWISNTKKEKHRIRLESGSLIAMSGKTQQYHLM